MAKKSANVYSTLGASNHATGERAQYDLYCTHPKAVEELLKIEQFSHRIWEPCDGLGHISDTLIANGYDVRRSDIATRGRNIEQVDFLQFRGGGGTATSLQILPTPAPQRLSAKPSRLSQTGARWRCGCGFCFSKAKAAKSYSESFRQNVCGFHHLAYHAATVMAISGGALRGTPGIFGRKVTTVKLN